MTNIRNFAIISHVDHGKSTLADRLLEITGTVPKEKLIPQYLDRLSLERERGITIKMQPVRMYYTLNAKPYTLNLIDTPGHADFTYEVSRALKAVEGAVLLVDALKGVQAQTVFNFKKAVEQKLVIIPVINKIDLPNADIERVEKQIIYLFEGIGFRVQGSEILKISAKTGEGVDRLLEAIIEKIPPPHSANSTRTDLVEFQALIFDSLYDSFKGVLAYVRVFSGKVKIGEVRELAFANRKFVVKEVGMFTPDFKPIDILRAGEIGYIATGIKEPGLVKIGDTIRSGGAAILEGFSQPQPKVFASFYPLEEGEFETLKSALEKFTLTDPAVSFERTESPLLGRGFRCGFLGKLHMEIAAARLDEELSTKIIVGTPTVAYRINNNPITSPADFPEHAKGYDIQEPWVRVHLFTPSSYLGAVLQLLKDSNAVVIETSFLDGKSIKVLCEMPLAQIVTKNFYDTLKSVSQGFASLEYEPLEYRASDAVRLDILVAGEYIDAFSKILPRRDAYNEGRRLTKLLKEILPKAQFVVSLQARVEGKYIAREDIPALKKAVTAPLYGGDWSRKKKLLVKQRKGKERLRQFGRVAIPKEVFLKVI
ncbi:MAG: elongation factor 4 [Candidatus Portnoybacteria bacterium]|nr:elongation factor 4 [Candidatus Portnoybacteria bacterium]